MAESILQTEKAVPDSVIQRIKKIAEPYQGKPGCWEWPKSRNVQTGYGQISHYAGAGKHVIFTAHRAAFAAFVGGPAQVVCHSCDNPGCFNPAHLFAGTQRDNILDMHAKGRSRDYLSTAARGDAHGSVTKPEATLRGTSHPKAKLTEQDVRDIRASPLGCYTLARRYGVADATVNAIQRGKTWKHVI
ncbi:HNH endonuclease [Achromobacter xylosoxidans]